MIASLLSWLTQEDWLSTPEHLEKPSTHTEETTHSPRCLPKRPPKDISTVYEECKLVSGEFRVFLMDPSESYDSRIVGHLCSLPFDSAGRFAALSYRWEGSLKNTIDINGAELAVTENLFFALKALRSQSGGLPTPIWVDSICINQMDIAERSQQVPLMGQIYSEASPVRVWLGEECAGVKEAFKLVDDCGECSPEEAVARVLQDEKGTKALTEVLHRSYWDRMWMFQEIVLAGHVTVHCGGHEVPWTYVKWLNTLSGYVDLWRDAQVHHAWILEIRKALFKDSLFGIPREEAQDINAVITQTRDLHCQDPRDKLFALVGVCEPLSRMLKVDYSAPARDVYTSFTRSQIQADGELYMILTAGIRNHANGVDLDLPSWVPDFRGTAAVDTQYMGGAYLELFNADNNGGHDPYFAFSEDSGHSILQVEAFLLETVLEAMPFENDDEASRRRMTETFCQADDGEFSVSKLRQFFQVTVSENSGFYGHKLDDDGTLKERMERLILGFYGDLQRLHESSPVFNKFLESFNSDGLDLIDCQLRSSASDSELTGNGVHRNELQYLQRILVHKDSRDSTMFNTSGGKMGICPQTTQHGDLVAIVRGCRVPVLLRKQEQYFRLVGPAYVSGVMQGEALSGVDCSKASPFTCVEIV